MKFDFTNLRRDTPRDYKCIQADQYALVVKHLKSGRIFRVEKTGQHQFTLYARGLFEKTEDEKGHFVMRSDIGRLLYLLGYIKTSQSLPVQH